MINVLINAYAVSPNHGSEPGVGWNWTIELAKYCNVYVITEAEFKEQILVAVQHLPQKDNIHFYFNNIGEKARKMCWNQGDYRFYYYYRKWQKNTLAIAETIISENKIDVIHQLNMIGYREPGYLWKIKDIPFVWGPIGGFNFVKFSYLISLGSTKAVFYCLKNILNYIQAVSSIRVRLAIRRSDLLLAASRNTQTALKKFYKKKSIILNETGCHIPLENREFVNPKNQETFNILWVGRFIPTKLLGLALQTISNVKDLKGLTFHIVGDGLEPHSLDSWQNYAISLGLQNQCKWHGQIAHKEVQILMRKSNLLFFTSIAEGTSHVVLESISNSLPILCFDTCGHGEIVTDEIGRKIPIEKPSKSIKRFASEIEYFYYNRQALQIMSNNCNSKLNSLSWDSKGIQMLGLYQTVKLEQPYE